MREEEGVREVVDRIVERLDRAVELLKGEETVDSVCEMLDELDEAYRLYESLKEEG